VPRSEAEGRRAARDCERGAALKGSGAKRPWAVESKRLRETHSTVGLAHVH